MKKLIWLLLLFISLTACGQDKDTAAPSKDIEALIQDLKFGSPSIQLASIQELEKRQDLAAVKPLLEKFARSTNPEICTEIAITLCKLNPKDTIPLILNKAKENPYNKNYLFIDAIAETKDERVFDALLWNLQNNESLQVHYRAIQGLSTLGDIRACPILSDKLELTKNSVIKLAIVNALVELKYEPITPTPNAEMSKNSFSKKCDEAGFETRRIAKGFWCKL